MPGHRRAQTALAAISLSILACNAILAPTAGDPQAATGPAVAAVALRLDANQDQLSGFVGEIADPWNLAPGSYFVSAVDQDGHTLVLPSVQVDIAPLTWPQDFESAGAGQDVARRDATHTLVEFLLVAEMAKLTALENSSAGFSQPLFAAEPGQDALNALYERYAEIAARESAVLEALDAIPLSFTRAPGLAAPPPDWKETLFGFFGYAGNAGARAAERLEKISSSMSPEDKADAFEAVRDAFKGGARNFDELLVLLGSGALNNQAAQIESDMRNAPGFVAAAQAANATTAQVVHQEGGELVSKGAELEAWLAKAVLKKAFPGIGDGWDLADKALKWDEYLRKIYKDGLLAGGQAIAVDTIKDKLKESLLGQLKECCPELDDLVAEEITDDLADKLATEIVSLEKENTTAPAGSDEQGNLVIVRGSMEEIMRESGGESAVLTTSFELLASHEAGTVTGSLDGTGSYEWQAECTDDSSQVLQSGAGLLSITTSADVNATLDAIAGEFSAPISVTGRFELERMTRPFTDGRCLDMNAESEWSLPFAGAGTIHGVISPTGEAAVNTEWGIEELVVTGSWIGQGQVGP